MKEIDQALLKTLKTTLALRNDAAVAKLFELSRTSVHKISRGQLRFGMWTRLKILSLVKTGNIDAYALILSNQSLIKSLTANNDICDAKDFSYAMLFDAIRQQFNLGNDEELGQLLGLSAITISSLRHHRSTLGPLPRLKLLKALDKHHELPSIETLQSNAEIIRQLQAYTQTPDDPN